MINFNATFLVQLLLFLITLGVLNRILYKPILKVMEDRDQHIKSSKNQITNIAAEAKELAEKCVNMEKDARKQAGEEGAQLRAAAADTAEKIFNDTRAEITGIRDSVSKEIDDQFQRAQDSLKSEATLLADSIAEKVAGRRV